MPRSTSDKLSARPGRDAEEVPDVQAERLPDAPQRRAIRANVYDDIKKSRAPPSSRPVATAWSSSGTSTIPFPFPKSGRRGALEPQLSAGAAAASSARARLVCRAAERGLITAWRTTYRFWRTRIPRHQARQHAACVTGQLPPPATLEGTICWSWDTIDQGKEARSGWIYNAGQRRVRRIPELCCDYSADGTEGLRFTDQYDALERHHRALHWKLVGKKEMYIPYNVYKLSDKTLKAADVVQARVTSTPSSMRYELHRVWVAEGTLKAGKRHMFAKRTMLRRRGHVAARRADLYDSARQALALPGRGDACSTTT